MILYRIVDYIINYLFIVLSYIKKSIFIIKIYIIKVLEDSIRVIKGKDNLIKIKIND